MKWLLRLLSRVFTVFIEVMLILSFVDEFKRAIEGSNVVAAALGGIVLLYIVSVLWNLVCVIFNFITRFDVYDSFGDGVKASFYPLALVITIPRHIIGTIVYLFRGERSVSSYKNTGWEEKTIRERETDGSDPREKDEYYFMSAVEKEVKNAVGRVYPVSDTSAEIYSSWSGYPSATVFKGFKSVTINARLNIRYHFWDDYTEGNIRDCVDETRDSLMEAAEAAIDRVVSRYQGYDGNWKVTVNLSHNVTKA